MKVVLLAINAKYVHSSLSVWVIANGIAKFAQFPHDVSVVEATINQKIIDVADAVLRHNPDVIGISSYIWNAGMLPELLVLLREQLPDAVFVLGGPEASNNVEYWLVNGADYVLQGEGEYYFPQFIDKLVDGKSIKQEDDSSVSRQEDNSLVFEEAIDPYTDSYLAALNGRLSYIETSRGCPFQCLFCLSARSDVRYFPIATVKEQILKLSQADTKTIKFVDRTFNCHADRAYEIFEYILGLDTTCRFHFEVAADLFDERLLSLLESAPPGRIQFEIGLQSFFKPALTASSRQMNIEKAEQNIQELMEMENVHIHVDLIAGLPYETLAEFINSFNRAYALNTHTLQLGFLKLLHGSELRKQAESLGIYYSPDPPYEIIQSPWLSIDDLMILKKTENALQHTRNKGRFLSALNYLQAITRMKPFSLMHALGEAVPSHATQLEDYAAQIYDFFTKLPGVEKSALQDCLTYDWLGMVKGKNAPIFMKNDNPHRKRIAEIAEKTLERKVKREEYAVLNSGLGAFVDSSKRNPVTGLYKVHLCR